MVAGVMESNKSVPVADIILELWQPATATYLLNEDNN